MKRNTSAARPAALHNKKLFIAGGKPASGFAMKTATGMFDRGNGPNFDFEIEMMLQGLKVNPSNLEVHRRLRSVSLQRKASGGRPLSLMERFRMNLKSDQVQQLLNAEKLLAYDPGNVEYMLAVLNASNALNFDAVTQWIQDVLRRARRDFPGGMQ